MDLDRTSIPERTQERRPRPQPQPPQETAEPTRATAPSVAPDHGGALAASSLARQPDEGRPDPQAEARRHEAYEAISRFLHLPGGTELDIHVDVEEEQVTFQIRDRATGRLLKEVPEGDSGSLVEKLRDYAGTLVNRSL